jgi:hypothetical protein
MDWNELADEYPQMVRDCEERVVRWACTQRDADWEVPYPLWSQRLGREPRRREVAVPDDPEKWPDLVRYGFDAEGAVVLARRFTVIRGESHVNREALWTTVDGREAYVWRTYPPLQDRIVGVAIPHRQGGLVRHVDTWYGDGRRSCEAYTYDHERLTVIAQDKGSRFRIDYDDDGELAAIWASNPEHDEGRESVAYRRKSPRHIAKARREAEELLCAGIRTWAERQHVAGVVRVLVIGYGSPPDDVLPPPLGIGQQDDAVLADVASGDTAPESQYSVADQGIFDPEPAEFTGDISAFQALNQEWRSTNDPEAARRLLVSVAKKLNNHDWSKVFPALDEGFAVVAVNVELDDVERDLHAVGLRR